MAERCARASGWCDGRVCRDNGIDCPNAHGTQLGAHLRQQRLASGTTLRQLEKRTGINSGYLSQVERGLVREPSTRLLGRLADAYGLPVERLLSWATGERPAEFPSLFNPQADIIVIAHEDHTELRLPNVGEPVILRPGQRHRIVFRSEITWPTQGEAE